MGTDLDIGFAPAREGGGFPDGAVLQFDKVQDELVFRMEAVHGAADAQQSMGFLGLLGMRGGGNEVADFEGEGIAGDFLFAAQAVAAEEVVAGPDGDAAEPVAEGGGGPPRGQAAPDADEDILGEVLQFVVIAGVFRCHREDAALVDGNEFCEGCAAAGGGSTGEGVDVFAAGLRSGFGGRIRGAVPVGSGGIERHADGQCHL